MKMFVLDYNDGTFRGRNGTASDLANAKLYGRSCDLKNSNAWSHAVRAHERLGAAVPLARAVNVTIEVAE